MIQQILLKTSGFLLGSFLLLSCSKGSNGYGSNNNNNNSSSGSAVSINNMAFSAATITVKVGTTVTWTNNEYMKHTVTADDGSFNSGDMNYGDKFSHAFSKTGTYAYHCGYHAFMTGSVIENQ